MFILTLYPNLPVGKRWGKLSSQNSSFRIDFDCLLSPEAILTYSFYICDCGLTETRHVSLATDLYWTTWSFVSSGSNTSSIFMGIGMSS